jgi:hypothetical protein
MRISTPGTGKIGAQAKTDEKPKGAIQNAMLSRES